MCFEYFMGHRTNAWNKRTSGINRLTTGSNVDAFVVKQTCIVVKPYKIQAHQSLERET